MTAAKKERQNMAMVDLKSPEGTVPGYLAMPKKGRGPGVLVLHAWWGLNDFFKGVCDQFATAGFVAFAPDLYRGATASTRDGAERLMSKLDQKVAGQDILNGVRGLQSHPGVKGQHLGVIGFSMGAFWSLWLAQELPADVAAVVRDLEKDLRSRVEHLTFYTYPGTTHWFFEKDRPDAYNAPAAKLAWQRTIRFLTTQLSEERAGDRGSDPS